MNSARSPSSCKKPRFCAKGRELYEAMSSENPILILSAAWTEEWRMEIMNKQLIIFFIEHLPVPLAQSELEAYASTSYALSNGRSASIGSRWVCVFDERVKIHFGATFL